MRYKISTLIILSRLIKLYNVNAAENWQPSLNTILVLFDMYIKCEWGGRTEEDDRGTGSYFKAAKTLEDEFSISPAMRKKILADLQSWHLIRNVGTTKNGIIIWKCNFSKPEFNRMLLICSPNDADILHFAIIPTGAKDKYRCLVEAVLYALCFAPSKIKSGYTDAKGEKVKIAPYTTAVVFQSLGGLISDDTVRKKLGEIERDGGFWIADRTKSDANIKIKTTILNGEKCVFLPSEITNAQIGVEFYSDGERECHTLI